MSLYCIEDGARNEQRAGSFGLPADFEPAAPQDTGSTEPLEDDMVPDSVTLTNLQQKLRETRELLEAHCPGGEPRCEWRIAEHEGVNGKPHCYHEWTCSVKVGETSVVGWDEVLDVAVAMCLHKLAALRAAAIRRADATPVEGAGLERVLNAVA